MGDAEEKLKALAAEAQADERKVLDAERDAKQAERDKEEKAARKKRENDRAAPGYFAQLRFFAIAGTALTGGALLGGAWSEGANVLPVVTWGAPLLTLAFLVTWLDSRTWKRRLPFEVVGDDVIGGRDSTDSDRVPWIGVTVRIVLQRNQPHPAIASTLQVLASRVNKEMKKDKDAQFEAKQHWFVKHDLLRGEVDKSLYTTRMLEKWLRREVRLLHEVTPVQRVEVNATYTGSSYWAPSSD